MNILVLAAGIVTTLTTTGHFAVGTKMFLVPILAAPMDLIVRKQAQSIFHYVSVYLILSAVTLLWIGVDGALNDRSRLVVQFIAANYVGFAIWQLQIALTSGLKRGPLQMFQWLFFTAIAALAGLGSL